MVGNACVVYHGATASPQDFDAGTDAEPHNHVSWKSADELFATTVEDHAAVLIVDKALLDQPERLKKLAKHVVVVAATRSFGK